MNELHWKIKDFSVGRLKKPTTIHIQTPTEAVNIHGKIAVCFYSSYRMKYGVTFL